MKLNECILTDLGSVNRGKSKHRPRNDKSLFGGKYPFIQTGEVKSANFYLNTYSETYNDKGLAQSKLWEEGTLLITIAANIAETAILSIKACFPDSIIGFIPYANKSDVRFVKYYLDYIKKKLQVISQGTTQDNMSVEKLTSMKLFVPDYINQVKIANILSNYDNLIENNNKRIKLLENMAEELYKEWFVRLRFPNYQNTKILDGIPDGWENNTISEIATFINGYAFKSDDFNDKGNSSIIKIKNIGNNTIDVINVDKVEDVITEKISNKFKISENDLLIAMTGATVGKVGLMPKVNGDFFLNQRVGKIESKYKYFILSELKSYKGQSNINNLAAGAAQPNISSEQILGIKTLIPDENLLIKFENILKEIYLDILFLNSKNQNLKETRDLLLPRLISGKLDIKDLHII